MLSPSISNTYSSSYSPDFIAKDRQGNPILFAQVSLEPYSFEKTEEILKHWQKKEMNITFQILADLIAIQVFKSSQKTPICIFNTVDILDAYDLKVKMNTILNPYLSTLIEAWIRDLAYHWNLNNPPAASDLAKIGLLEKLKEGSTKRID